ncbi:MAG: Ig-like domain-containing protein [Clostridia bacterium]|nr:Ig-like domain-containing protein [Clostridia bacterium]
MNVRNKIFAILLSMCLLLTALPLTVFAEPAVLASGNFSYYGISSVTWCVTDDGVLTIGGTGPMPNFDSFYTDAPYYPYKDQISKLVINEGVTKIGSMAFRSWSNLTGTLVIPESVREIADGAFRFCSGFADELVIPRGVEKIGGGAFNSCTGLTKLTFVSENSALKTISNAAFHHCTNLDCELKLPIGLETIGFGAFRECYALKGDITIPDSVKYIGYEAFLNCRNLDGTLVLGTENSQLQTIEEEIFAGCSKLKGSVYIPSGVTTLGNRAFSGCSSLDGTITFCEGLQVIEYDAFNGCVSLKGSVKIPNTVTTIGANAFVDCKGLDGTITLGSGLQSIGEQAFENCKKLTGDLIIPDGVTTIGNEAFQNCESLSGTLSIPASAENIGLCAFHGCAKNGDIMAFFAQHPEYVEKVEVSRTEPTITSNGSVTYKINCTDSRHSTAAGRLIKTEDETLYYTYITSISAEPEEMTLAVGRTGQIVVTVAPDDAMDPNVTFMSGDEGIATVDENGLITAVAPGTTTVTVAPADGSASAIKTVTVTVYDLTVPEKVVLAVGETEYVTPTVEPAGAVDPTYTYTASDVSVVTVDTDGKVTPVGPGTTTITVTDGVITKTIPVTIADVVAVADKTLLQRDETAQITVTEQPAGTLQSVTYGVSDTGVLSVSDTGVVTAIRSNGTATVTVTSTLLVDGETVTITKTIPFTVHTDYIQTITVTPDEMTLAVGKTGQIEATVAPDNAIDLRVSYASGDESVATVDETGKVTAVAPGTTTITVTPTVGDPDEEPVTATVTVTVYDLEVPEKLVIVVGETGDVTPTVDPAGAVTPAVTYTSSDDDIVTVDEDGKVTPVGPGTADVTVTDGDITKTVPVTVVSVTAEADKTRLKKEETGTVTVTTTPDGILQNVTYSVSDPRVLSVSDTGEYTALKTGTADVIVTATLLVDGETVTVVRTLPISVYTPVTSITASADKYLLSTEDDPEAVITVEVGPADADNKDVTYTSSDPSVLRVEPDGKVVAVGKGTATVTITAADGSGVQTTLTFTVTDDRFTLNIPSTLDLKEKGKAEVESDTDKPYTVEYTSSDPRILKIDPATGEYEVKGKGKVTVTAKIIFGDGTFKTISKEVNCVDPHEGEFRCKRCDWYDDVKDTPGLVGFIYWMIHTITHFVQEINWLT